MERERVRGIQGQDHAGYGQYSESSGKMRKGQGQLWAAADLLQRGVSSQTEGAGKPLPPHTRAGLQEDGAHLLTSPGLKLTEQWVLLKEHNPNERDSERREGWSKSMLRRETTL